MSKDAMGKCHRCQFLQRVGDAYDAYDFCNWIFSDDLTILQVKDT